MKCNICGNEENHTIYNAREMFYGTKEPFQYFECGACKCLQIVEVPEDMTLYYPSNYYTAAIPDILDFSPYDSSDEKDYIAKCLNLFQANYLLGIINSLDCSFLDIGCGAAGVVRNLSAMGLKRSVGIDAYLCPQHEYESENCNVYSSEIFDIHEKFDVILLNHSLEHMQQHQRVLRKVHELLTDQGVCIIRMPVASYAWNMYHTDWYQLDAPRHLIIHSFLSMETLFEQTNFTVKIFYTDSNIYQFISSELYRQDICLEEQRSINMVNYFTEEQINHFAEMTKMLNEENLGDQIIIILEKQ